MNIFQKIEAAKQHAHEPTVFDTLQACADEIARLMMVAGEPKPPRRIDWSALAGQTVIASGISEPCTLVAYMQDRDEFLVHNGNDMIKPRSYHRSIRLAESAAFRFWPGGPSPLPPGVEVEVVLRKNERITADAGAVRWMWSDEIDRSWHDVIGYRITGKTSEGWTF